MYVVWPRLNPKRLAELAREALQASRFDVAEQHARELVRAHPDRPQGPALLAEALASGGNVEEAVALLDQIAETFPDDPKLAAHARNLARTCGDMDRAITHARRLQALSPRDSKNLVFLIQSALDRRETQAALADIAQLKTVAPDEPRWDAFLARAQWQLGEVEQARQTVRSALQTRGQSIEALSQLLRLAVDVQDLVDPVPIASRLLELQPQDVSPLITMLAAARKASDLEGALRWSSALVEAQPSRAAWFLAKAKSLLALSRPRDAVDALRQGLELHASDTSLLSAGRDAALKADLADDALGFAQALETLAPGDARNNAFLAWIALKECHFDAALATCDRMVSHSPDYPAGWRFRAQALAAKFRIDEALESLDGALELRPDDLKLLKAQLNVAFHHGRFERAVDLARRCVERQPDDVSSNVTLVQSHMALGEPDLARDHLDALGPAASTGPLGKLVHHHRKLDKLRTDCPVLVEAWLTGLRNRGSASAPTGTTEAAFMIQYWSQGEPPSDVAFVVEQWRRLLADEGLGELALFDRASGRAWIAQHAPEFLAVFDKSFHFAMESDIFRIAFASRQKCIYMDIDSWPLEHTAEVLRYGLSQTESLLYFRSYQPWLVNGFFISNPQCHFVEMLVEQTLGLDLDAMEKNHTTIDTSFGPTRFNVVVKDLIAQSQTRLVEPAGAYGCSKLVLDRGTLHFVHEAAVAAVRPPFDLGYKGTADYWKRFTAET